MEAEDKRNEVVVSGPRQSQYFLIGLVIVVLAYLKREVWMGFGYQSQIVIYCFLAGQLLFFLALDIQCGLKKYVIENVKHIITLSWLVLCGVVLFLKFDEFVCLSLNEIGDLLAGMFAPLAMYWLIEAYRQQQKDLSYNRRSLDLQIKELQSSVKATQDIANTARDELRLSEDNHSIEKRAEDNELTPNFSINVEFIERLKDKSETYRLHIYSSKSRCPVLRVNKLNGDSEFSVVCIHHNKYKNDGENIIFIGGVDISVIPASIRMGNSKREFVFSESLFSIIFIDLRGCIRERVFAVALSECSSSKVHVFVKSERIVIDTNQ